MTDNSKNIGCLGFLINIFLKKEENRKEIIFEKEENLLSTAENSFHLVIKKIFLNEYSIFAKVRLADLVRVKGQNRMSGFGMIKSKHIDFIISDLKTSKVLLAIELDDNSHNKKSTQKSDNIKNNVLEEAGIPLLRVKAKKTYNLQELQNQIEKAWS